MTGELRKLYLECTTTYQHDHRTGIPRVVRNVIRHLRTLAKARGYDVVPVHFAGGALHPAVLTRTGDLAALPKPFGEHLLGTGRDAVRRVARRLPVGGLRDWLVAPSSARGLARVARRLVSVPGTRVATRETQAASGGIQPRRGDALVLADVSLGVDMKPTLALCQDAGVTIGALVYDLIPLQHPEWWPPPFSASFAAWLEPVLQYADRIVAISAAVADDLLRHSSSLPAGRVRPGQSIGWFHLGHDLDPIAPDAVIRPQLRAVFGEGVPVLLNVGWLDPRKNQLRLLDAFSELLRMGRPARLLLVGKLGVGGDPIIERLARDEALSRHVVVRTDLSDAELEYCFHNSRALIYPSLAEGFGLPLVEALSRGLPAFVSDIPAFREVAHDFAVFLDPQDPSAMAQLLDGFLRTGRYDVRRPLAEFRWPTWDQSVADLMDRLQLPRPVNTRLRIGLGTTLLDDPATRDALDGIGVYTRELRARFDARVDVEVVPAVMRRAAARAAPPETFSFPVHRNVMAAWSLATGRPFAGNSALARRIDVFFATDYRVPRLRGIPVCATVFDAIPLSHPEWASPRLRALKNHVLRSTIRWADRVIAISHAMVPVLVEHYAVPEERIDVAHLGVDERWFEREPDARVAAIRKHYRLDRHYLLFVGTLQPRKNVAAILAAFGRLPPAFRSEVQLVIAGRAGWQTDALVTALRAAQEDGRVRWLDYVPAADMRALYQGASAFVFPSLYEGFGLPVLEAFAAGVPVVCSNVTSLPEVAGDAALQIDPTDVVGLASAMEALVSDDALAQKMRERGRHRAREFTWDRCAERTLVVLRSMV